MRVELFGDEVEQITVVDPLTGERIETLDELVIFPATHYATSEQRMQAAIERIQVELQERLKAFEDDGKLLEAQRLRMRTEYDLEMMQEVGYCNGIENYSGPDRRAQLRRAAVHLARLLPVRLLDGDRREPCRRAPAARSVRGRPEPQGDPDRARVPSAVGGRQPAAALRGGHGAAQPGASSCRRRPGDYELQVSSQVVEQIVRPTGLIDPEVIVKPTKGQIDDLHELIKDRVDKNERVLVTTLTKKMAEDLTDYLLELGIRVRYLHSEVDTIQRIEILRDLRLGEFDVLVGINLLREGLDLPEVSLVAILDADKEGFLRSETSLIQMIGRAARNVAGEVVMYADQMTDSMQRAISETMRRRGLQQAYNEEHGINPQTVRKEITDILSMIRPAEDRAPVPEKLSELSDRRRATDDLSDLPEDELERLIRNLEQEMRDAAVDLRFEYAARLRDEVKDLKRELREIR